MMELILLYSFSQLSTQMTQWLAFDLKQGAVRASSITTLALISLSSIMTIFTSTEIHSIIIGATFVGLSDPKRLNKKMLVWANLIFSLLFHYGLQHMQGIGGAMGFFALIGCLAVYAGVKLRNCRCFSTHD